MASKKTSTEPVSVHDILCEDRREFRKYMNQVDYFVATGAIQDEKLREITEYLKQTIRAVTQY